MSTVFEADHAVKRYGRKTVLHDVDLAVGPGHCVALLGHNGAGKTTLIKALLGLTDLDAGEVRLFGVDPTGRAGGDARRAVGYLPENVAFHDMMTGRELLRFYAGLKSVDRRQCDRLLEEVGLDAAARQRVSTYSKGMRQRLGLAQALLGEPRLLFLDEPTNGLDPPLRHQFYNVVETLTGRGATAVVSSHVLTEIEARADLVAILRRGRLAAFGSLGALRRRSGLPVRLRLKVKPDAVGGIAEEIGGQFALAEVVGGAMEFVCDTTDKMAIVRRVAKLNGVVEDVDILPPHLEEIYAHFMSAEASSCA